MWREWVYHTVYLDFGTWQALLSRPHSCRWSNLSNRKIRKIIWTSEASYIRRIQRMHAAASTPGRTEVRQAVPSKRGRKQMADVYNPSYRLLRPSGLQTGDWKGRGHRRRWPGKFRGCLYMRARRVIKARNIRSPCFRGFALELDCFIVVVMFSRRAVTILCFTRCSRSLLTENTLIFPTIEFGCSLCMP